MYKKTSKILTIALVMGLTACGKKIPECSNSSILNNLSEIIIKEELHGGKENSSSDLDGRFKIEYSVPTVISLDEKLGKISCKANASVKFPDQTNKNISSANADSEIANKVGLRWSLSVGALTMLEYGVLDSLRAKADEMNDKELVDLIDSRAQMLKTTLDGMGGAFAMMNPQVQREFAKNKDAKVSQLSNTFEQIEKNKGVVTFKVTYDVALTQDKKIPYTVEGKWTSDDVLGIVMALRWDDAFASQMKFQNESKSN